MIVKSSPLAGCLVIEPTVHRDTRGLFLETFNQKKYADHGVVANFVQDNMSISHRKTLRGFHMQRGQAAQAKLVWVTAGAVLDIVIDLRPDSPTFKKSFSLELTSENYVQMFVPRGFAHGFVCLSEAATFSYKCDNFFVKDSEIGIRFDDPELNLNFPFPQSELIISDKDRGLPFLKDVENLL